MKKLLRVQSAIAIGGAVIAAIIAGNAAGYRGFSTGTFFLTLIVGVLAAVIATSLHLALAEVLENQESILSRLHDLERNNIPLNQAMTSSTTTGSSSASSLPQPSLSSRVSMLANKTPDGGWICSQCKTKNSSSSQYCKDCGKYK